MAARIPEPDAQALAVSHQLAERIREELDAADGWMSFERYMQRALYEPGLGYYSGGSTKLGAAGDFVTAPELSPVFGQVLAREIQPVLEAANAPIILELGAGTGRLAECILAALDDDVSRRLEYQILEPSADLAQRQRLRLASVGDRVRWLAQLPVDPFEGVILANEVLDAFPVTRFVKRAGHARSLGVGLERGAFVWAEGPADPELGAEVEALEARLGYVLPEGFRSELSRSLSPWIASLSDCLARGALLVVDYGLVRHEYYHLSRFEGTLVCHYRHRAHTDPFLFPGLQDISAWVDFSACAQAATDAGLVIAGFTTQGHFLLEGGATDFLQRSSGRVNAEQAQAFKTLVLPGEMGERFKVLLLTCGITRTLPGRDFRDRL
jgi:SAM-dependent MidA family methyltransferase